MPRAEKVHMSGQYYHSQLSSSYLPDSSTSSASPPMSPPSSLVSQRTSSNAANSPSKKKHVCSTCERAFTTSGHLARHSRVHTGERNHKCPFPGCETRCSRQDNLQQHYRIHLSPGSRRNSARSSGARKRLTTVSTSSSSESVIPPPPLTPPPLEQSRIYSPPPLSPPPLVQATLPAAATLPIPNSRFESASGRLSSSSPDSYLGSQELTLSGSGHLNYNYRSGTTTYQEQSQTSGSGFTYVHTTPISGPSSSGTANNSGSGTFVPYQNTETNFSSQHPHQHPTHFRNIPAPISSRHSISHINNPHYPPSQHLNDNPPSPASLSVSSHNSAPSGPPTPPYSLSYDDGYSQNSHEMLTVHSGMHNGHMGAQSHYLQNGYSSNPVGHVPRFASPPPTLAPIQDERYIRRQEPRHLQTHVSSPYIHQPQPLSTEYSYHHMSLGHGGWRTDVRKGEGVILNS